MQYRYRSFNMKLTPTELVMHYKCNDNLTGSYTVTDEEGTNGTSAEYTGDISISGRINRALSLTQDHSGTDDSYIQTNQDFANVYNDEFSVAFWISFQDGQPNYENIIWSCPYDTNNENKFAISLDTDGYIGVQYRPTTGGTNAKTATALADGSSGWIHYAIVVAKDRIRIYKNGSEVQLDGTDDGDMGGTIMSTFSPAHNTTIGYTDEGYTIDGFIDDVRVYKGALTPQQIAGLYNGGSGTED